MTASSTNWKAVTTYYLIACLWSWPFFWWRDVHPESWKPLEIPSFFKNWLIMWGPGISALICFYIFRSHRRKMNLNGSNIVFGLLTVSIYPIVLASLSLDPYFLAIGMIGFVSILGEELGWRGFLQDALKLRTDFQKALIIGISWEFWHFTNRIVNRTLISSLIMISMWAVITILFSYVMIKLTKRNHSLLIPITGHMALNASFQFQYGWQSALICLPLWAAILYKWNKEDIVRGVTS